jgi:uncharacterized protein YkwD
MRATPRWPIVLLLVAAAGCSGDSNDAQTGGGLTTAETTGTAPAPEAKGSIGDATFAEDGGDEEVLSGESPITPKSTHAAAGDKPLPHCTDDTLAVTPATKTRAEASAVCIVNKVRRRRGRRELKTNAQLYNAAEKHATDMVQGQYFSHVSKGGTTAAARMRAAGYPSTAGGAQVGENLAWGSGTYSTPAAIVQSWMNSPGHRQNILRRAYREAGLAIALGTPVPASGEAGTYVQTFGRKR